MRSVPTDAAVFLYTGILDMRVGMDRLAETVSASGFRVLDGGYFLFFSRTRD